MVDHQTGGEDQQPARREQPPQEPAPERLLDVPDDDLDALQEIPILMKGGALQGSGDVANFSLVQAVGCLAEGPNHTWVMTQTSSPVYTTSPAASNASRTKALADAPAGAATFQLINALRLKPEAMKGQRVEAKGFIYRDGPTSQIAVSALQSLGASCGN